jgi:hypothetical protein
MIKGGILTLAKTTSYRANGYSPLSAFEFDSFAGLESIRIVKQLTL